jgi:hypothetical protein
MFLQNTHRIVAGNWDRGVWLPRTGSPTPPRPPIVQNAYYCLIGLVLLVTALQKATGQKEISAAPNLRARSTAVVDSLNLRRDAQPQLSSMGLGVAPLPSVVLGDRGGGVGE